MFAQQQDEYQKENENSLIYSTTITTTTNIWLSGNDRRPTMYIPKEIASRHKMDRPSKVAVYDLQQGIFIRFLHYNKQNIRRN